MINNLKISQICLIIAWIAGSDTIDGYDKRRARMIKLLRDRLKNIEQLQLLLNILLA